ncbi:MAG: NHLP leader peptide family RiPP precursor [Candidatus Eremiobacterota bacterium]
MSEENKDLSGKILARVLKDEDFKKSLIENPGETLSKEYDIKLPEGLTLKILEDTPEVKHVVLPCIEPAALEELSEEAIDNIAAADNWRVTVAVSVGGLGLGCLFLFVGYHGEEPMCGEV